MGKKEERERFINDSSQSDYYPYSWELDGHPAMQRPPGRKLRHDWRTTRADWVKAIMFLGVLGMIFGVILLIDALR